MESISIESLSMESLSMESLNMDSITMESITTSMESIAVDDNSPLTTSQSSINSTSTSTSTSSQNSGLVITRITDAASFEPYLSSLRKLLQRCVNDDPPSSSIGFLAPLSDHAAISYWLDLLPLATGPDASAILLVATHPDVPGVLATAQIGLMPKETHAHKGEVRKLLVHPTYRRHGFGRLMMGEVERLAREELKLDVLVLDTAREAPAREFYVKAGWTEWGVCPDYAKSADGKKHACSFFIKRMEESL